jgi:hypothetical protein
MLSEYEDEVVPAKLMDELWEGAKIRGRRKQDRNAASGGGGLWL